MLNILLAKLIKAIEQAINVETWQTLHSEFKGKPHETNSHLPWTYGEMSVKPRALKCVGIVRLKSFTIDGPRKARACGSIRVCDF
jgi:hypothetical protein